jgi:integrase/recombinase XerD
MICHQFWLGGTVLPKNEKPSESLNVLRIGGVIQRLFERKAIIKKHSSAHLLKERERFLLHLLERGVSVKTARFRSQILLHTVKLLKLQELRTITRQELALAFRRDLERRQRHKPGLSQTRFSKEPEQVAVRWLEFLGKLKRQKTRKPFRAEMEHFMEYWRERQLGPVTLEHLRIHVGYFLRWYSKRKQPISRLRLQDVDSFVLSAKAAGWSALSLNTLVRAIRRFFQYGEERGWCKPGLARGIITPNRMRSQGPRKGRDWEEVRKLLKSITQSDIASIRAKAIITLMVTYALRCREVERLTPLDLDWDKRIVTIRRSKRGPAQRYPLNRAVTSAVLRYMKVRPLCSCDRLFVTLNPPYRAVSCKGLHMLVRHRLKKIGITTGPLGPHSLRHARATQLLQKGLSLKQVSDFLGHSGLDVTLRYAKYSVRQLRAVADFDFGDLM